MAAKTGTVQKTLKEGEDYYLDPNGLLVFTEAYHLKRGDCCGSRCRHCPYDYKNVKQGSGEVAGSTRKARP